MATIHTKPYFLLVIFFVVFLRITAGRPGSSSDYPAPDSDFCDSKRLPRPHLLQPNKLTVLLSGFSEARLPLLRSLAASYASHPLVSSVQILWSNPQTPAATLARTLHPFLLHRSPSTSLNFRFLPRRSILTRAVAVADDDIEIPHEALSFAFSVFLSRPDRLVGFFPRSHDLDLAARSWIYTVHPDRYSILLTKFFIMGADYLYEYSCGGGETLREMRAVVDRRRNCEDILMNFVAAERTGGGPVLVEGKGVRDWGDKRNQQEQRLKNEIPGSESSGEVGEGEEEGGKGRERVSGVGLSKRGGHWQTRGECIRDFHKIMGKMPLKYGYGKVVREVREQALCEKAGKLVLCDQNAED